MAKSKGNTIASVRGEDDWQVESDLRTMIECEKIEADPKRLSKVKAMAKTRMMDMAAIATESKDGS